MHPDQAVRDGDFVVCEAAWNCGVVVQPFLTEQDALEVESLQISVFSGVFTMQICSDWRTIIFQISNRLVDHFAMAATDE